MYAFQNADYRVLPKLILDLEPFFTRSCWLNLRKNRSEGDFFLLWQLLWSSIRLALSWDDKFSSFLNHFDLFYKFDWCLYSIETGTTRFTTGLTIYWLSAFLFIPLHPAFDSLIQDLNAISSGARLCITFSTLVLMSMMMRMDCFFFSIISLCHQQPFLVRDEILSLLW